MFRRFQPLLSAKVFSTEPGGTEKNYRLLKFPLDLSIKYDGIRLLEYGGQMVTRSLKPLRNAHVAAQTKLLIEAAQDHGLRGLDGEITVGPPNHPNVMQHTTSGVMSRAGAPEFEFYAFDSYQHASKPFEERAAKVAEFCYAMGNQFPWLKFVENHRVHSLEEMLAYEEEKVALGYEGIMGRKPQAHYKMGRSTMREGILVALKRFVDDEALILEYREELENTNEATENALGHTERSSHQENLVPKGRMGTMLAQSLEFEKTFWLGGGRGITHALRQDIWDNPERYQWRLATYVYQHVGVKERPRLPRFKAWRSWRDLDPAKAARFLQIGRAHSYSGKGLPALAPHMAPAL